MYNNTRRSPLLGAERKGFDAYILDVLPKDCPYRDKRIDSNKLTWSRGYINAWRLGYLKAAAYFDDFQPKEK